LPPSYPLPRIFKANIPKIDDRIEKTPIMSTTLYVIPLSLRAVFKVPNFPKSLLISMKRTFEMATSRMNTPLEIKEEALNIPPKDAPKDAPTNTGFILFWKRESQYFNHIGKEYLNQALNSYILFPGRFSLRITKVANRFPKKFTKYFMLIEFTATKTFEG
jgi:hypothetical protein